MEPHRQHHQSCGGEELLWRQIFSSVRHAQEDAEGARGKAILMASSYGMLTCGVMGRALSGEKGDNWLYAASVALLAVSSVVGIGSVFALRKIHDYLSSAIFAFFMLAIALADLQASMLLQEKLWPLFLPAVDFFVLIGVNSRCTYVFVFFTLLWVIVTDVEHLFRFGLFDDYAIPYSDRQSHACSCTNPPCKEDTGVAMTNLYFKLTALLFNFILVRYLVEAANMERDKVANGVIAAQSSAYYLARFDLDKAEQSLVDAAGHIPEGLAVAFFEILHNLRLYKPYLPSSCLPGAAHGGEGDDSDSPVSNENDDVSCASRASSDGTCVFGLPSTIPPDITLTKEGLRRTSSMMKKGSKENVESSAVTFSQIPRSASDDDFGKMVAGGGAQLQQQQQGQGQGQVQPGAGRAGSNLLMPHLKPLSSFRIVGNRGLPNNSVTAPRQSIRKESVFVAREPALVASRRSKLTLAMFNLHGSLHLIDEGNGKFEGLISHLLASVVGRFADKKGVVDLFLGDHIHGTFNASRSCPRHALGAVSAVREVFRELEAVDMNVAIATGRASHGDLGCTEMKRYSVFGKLPLILAAMERKGREWGVPVLLNSGCFTDTMLDYEVRLILKRVVVRWRPRAVSVSSAAPSLVRSALKNSENTKARSSTDGEPKVLDDDTGGAGMYHLYELLLVDRPPRAANDDNTEWMYTIQTTRWDKYNEAVIMMMKGKDAAAVRAHVQDCEEDQKEAFEHVTEQPIVTEYLEI